MKNKTNINFIIDAIMFVNMMAMAGIGFLIKYTLVPGYKENEIYGRDVDLYFLGMDRHEWGKIHLAISLFFIFLLALHIILHWKTIVSFFRRLFADKKKRTIIAPVFLVLSFLLITFSFMVKPDIETVYTGSGQMHGRENTAPLLPSDNLSTEEEPEIIPEDHSATSESASGSDSEHVHSKEYAVNGTMTLMEVGNLYNVPTAFILYELNIPENIPVNTRLGLLRRSYGFTMSDVELIIIQYKANQ
ncbi:MAG: DUF4405 domain-containing protein [Bacteroidales bacterium]|nr:DUF4405 domain-containing protein [Bacteroidales bacterium]